MHSEIIVVEAAHFKRNSSLRIVGNNFSHSEDIPVSIAALMEAKAPVRLHDCLSGNFGVLNTDILGVRSGQEIQVKDTAKEVVFKELASNVVDLDVFSGSAQEENGVSACCTPVIEVDGMVA